MNTLLRPTLRALAFVAFVLSFSLNEAPADEGERSRASDFTLSNLDGDPVQLSGLEGKVVVVNFWATWCAPCIQELPFLSDFQKTYEDKGLVVLAVATDGPETVSDVRRLVRRKRWGFQVLLDQDGRVNGLLNPRGNNPFTLFIDRQGRIASAHEGYTPGDESEYEKLLEVLLTEAAP